MFGTSILWVDGQISSYFFPVKMSIPTRWTYVHIIQRNPANQFLTHETNARFTAWEVSTRCYGVKIRNEPSEKDIVKPYKSWSWETTTWGGKKKISLGELIYMEVTTDWQELISTQLITMPAQHARCVWCLLTQNQTNHDDPCLQSQH